MSERVQGIFFTKIRKVVLAYERGTQVKEIASRIGVSPPTITKWLIQEGYKRKKRGRVPLAMKARIVDLRKRGWPNARIASLLDISTENVVQYSKPEINPILGGQKDPLAIRGERPRKKEKTKGRKKKGAKSRKKEKQLEGYPPPRHKCRKHWSDVEKSYVMQLMMEGISVLDIYKRMRASKKRQRRIWHEFGNKGDPPNFPPPKGPPTGPPPGPPPSLPPAEVKKRREAARAMADASAERLIALEEEAAARQQRIAELEAQALEDENRIKALEEQRKKLRAEHRKRAESLAVARAKLPEAEAPEEEQRVLPGSFEEEELGLPIGKLVKPKKPGKKPKPQLDVRKYADNGRYFVVSTDWADLSDATPDELKLYATVLSANKFPARAERKGGMPDSYVHDLMPPKLRARFEKVLDKANDVLDDYRTRKKELAERKEPSVRILRYLLYAYDGWRNPKLSDDQRMEARKKLHAHWQTILKQKDKIDAYIMIFSLGYAEPNGAPTAKAIQKGFQARAILQRRKRLEERREEGRAQRSTQRAKKEQDIAEGAAMLAAFSRGESIPAAEETTPKIIQPSGEKVQLPKAKKKTKKKGTKKKSTKVRRVESPKLEDTAAEIESLLGGLSGGDDETEGAELLRGFRGLPEGKK